jgi:hypothetical protein
MFALVLAKLPGHTVALEKPREIKDSIDRKQFYPIGICTETAICSKSANEKTRHLVQAGSGAFSW